MTENQPKPSQERREFLRLNFRSPVEFICFSPDKLNQSKPQAAASDQAVSENISPSGILFRTENRHPEVSSVLWMNVDIRTLRICQEIEKRAIILNSGILGRVVRVEEDTKNNRAYDVGVCFLTQDQRNSKEIEKILSTISHSK